MYAFWKYDVPPYLLGAEVEEIGPNKDVVRVKWYGLVKPTIILPLEKGIKLQKKLDKAHAKYRKAVSDANAELKSVVKEITK